MKIPSKKNRKYSRPLRFLHSAAVFAILFFAAHLLGFRQYTAILSGTSSFSFLKNICGLTYLVLYLAVVVYVPILIIAAALAKLLNSCQSD